MEYENSMKNCQEKLVAHLHSARDLSRKTCQGKLARVNGALQSNQTK